MIPIQEKIWNDKYRFDGETIEGTWKRVAKALAKPENSGAAHYEALFRQALEDFKFVPAGRIIAGAGTGRRVTMSNCFTMGTIPDSMDGIFEALKEAALTMQQGGGIGYDFSTIRPKGADVVGVESDASGPLPFMDTWDAMCKTIMSAGSRRGAMMATLRCDHPDILDFVEAKRDPTRLRNFNLSVLVTDEFMQAVEKDDSWTLQFQSDKSTRKVIAARDLWDRIMQATYDVAEPGVIFIDRVNELHNLNYVEKIATTNPCGEKPMGPYASCILGSINLAKLVRDAFGPNAALDGDALDNLVRTAVRMLDNVVDAGNFPLPAQKNKAFKDRQIGLGVTGLADALFMCGFRYGGPEAAFHAERWMQHITEAAYYASVDLAKEKGPFETFRVDGFLAEGTFASTLPDDLKDQIREHGIRNSLLTSIAPTGTISLLAGNVSSGIEPVFAGSYERKVLNDDGTHHVERVVDYAVAEWERWFPEEPLPGYFVTAQDLRPEEHIRMQAAVQKWVDSSISKTVNLPEDISFEDFKAVYIRAYEEGCKGCTTYRPNETTGSVLSVETEASEEPCEGETQVEELAPRGAQLDGTTYKRKWKGKTFYVTINDDEFGNPFEIFIVSKDPQHYAWTSALTRMISAVFRRNDDVSFVAEELKEVFDPEGGTFVGPGYVPSMAALVGSVIEEHLSWGTLPDDYFSGPEDGATPDESFDLLQAMVETRKTLFAEKCPECGHQSLVNENGCKTCRSCGYSACG